MKKMTISMIRKIPKILINSILLLLLAGCALSTYRPVAGDYMVEDGFAIVHQDSMVIAVRPQAYRGSYREMDSNFFPMYVMVKNISGSRLNLPPQGFSLVADGRQYDYVPLDYILGSYRENLLLEQWDDPFNPDPLLEESREQNLESYYELMAAYFSFGELQPGASKEGYLFYNKAVRRAQNLEFDAMGTVLNFSKENK